LCRQIEQINHFKKRLWNIYRGAAFVLNYTRLVRPFR
jgi:hypothetical protein